MSSNSDLSARIQAAKQALRNNRRPEAILIYQEVSALADRDAGLHYQLGNLVTNIGDIGREIYVDPDRRKDLIRQIQAREVVSNYICRLYRRDRTVIWVSIRARAFRDAGGEPAGAAYAAYVKAQRDGDTWRFAEEDLTYAW